MWLYVYAPHLYLQTHYGVAFQQSPLALIHERHHSIMDMNPLAYEHGLREGMNIPTATSLSPECEFVTYDHYAMEDAHHQLANFGLNFASWVSLDTHLEQGSGMYMEVASMKRLMGEPKAIAETLRDRLPQYSFTVSSAPYPKAARLLAISGIERHLTHSNVELFLSGLQLERLKFSPKLELAFKKIGLKKLGELLKISGQDIAYRIDQALAQEVNQLIGKSNFLPSPYLPKPIFFQRIELQKEAEHHQQLVFPIKALLKNFCAFMDKRGLVSQQLDIEGMDRDYRSYPLVLKLARSTQSFTQWFELAQQRLERFQPETPILHVRGSCQWFYPFTPERNELFKGDQNESQGLKDLINQLTSRLNHNAVNFLRIRDHHVPEHQTQYTSNLSERTQKHESISNTPSLPPLGLLPHPKPINLTAYRLIQGPHRIHSLWWHEHPVIRDYYIAQFQQSALHWVFKDQNRKWYLHGYIS